MVDHDMKRRPLDGNSGPLQPEISKAVNDNDLAEIIGQLMPG